MKEKFTRQICGNVESCRTEAEIYYDLELVAVVYESGLGWQTEFFGTISSAADLVGLDKEIAAAREKLSAYVNRTGRDTPDGLTAAGLSLWLMEKEDGLAMGKNIEN